MLKSRCFIMPVFTSMRNSTEAWLHYPATPPPNPDKTIVCTKGSNLLFARKSFVWKALNLVVLCEEVAD